MRKYFQFVMVCFVVFCMYGTGHADGIFKVGNTLYKTGNIQGFVDSDSFDASFKEKFSKIVKQKYVKMYVLEEQLPLYKTGERVKNAKLIGISFATIKDENQNVAQNDFENTLHQVSTVFNSSKSIDKATLESLNTNQNLYEVFKSAKSVKLDEQQGPQWKYWITGTQLQTQDGEAMLSVTGYGLLYLKGKMLVIAASSVGGSNDLVEKIDRVAESTQKTIAMLQSKNQ